MLCEYGFFELLPFVSRLTNSNCFLLKNSLTGAGFLSLPTTSLYTLRYSFIFTLITLDPFTPLAWHPASSS